MPVKCSSRKFKVKSHKRKNTPKRVKSHCRKRSPRKSRCPSGKRWKSSFKRSNGVRVKGHCASRKRMTQPRSRKQCPDIVEDCPVGKMWVKPFWTKNGCTDGFCATDKKYRPPPVISTQPVIAQPVLRSPSIVTVPASPQEQEIRLEAQDAQKAFEAEQERQRQELEKQLNQSRAEGEPGMEGYQEMEPGMEGVPSFRIFSPRQGILGKLKKTASTAVSKGKEAAKKVEQAVEKGKELQAKAESLAHKATKQAEELKKQADQIQKQAEEAQRKYQDVKGQVMESAQIASSTASQVMNAVAPSQCLYKNHLRKVMRKTRV